MTETFKTFKLDRGFGMNLCDAKFPTSLQLWHQKPLKLSSNGTHFGYVQEGPALLQTGLGGFTLPEKMFFCVPNELSVEGGAGIIITRIDYKGIFGLGGPLEEQGRLRYIDGCRDTLLIPPLLKGDPCLNALYFPKLITQTPHTHPSVRIGIVAKGSGDCLTPEGVFPLQTGEAFLIAPEALHSFNTFDEEMIVIAYHPDSDFGATHEDHPMVNRTMIDGISAAKLENIRTPDV